MLDLVRILTVFALILLLLRRKWGVGYVLLAASVALAAFYLMPPAALAKTVLTAASDPVTIKLFFALSLIRAFEMILREKEVLQRMTMACRQLLKSRRAVIVSMPMLIGLMPSLGGAYFSAPMVDEATKGLAMPAEEKAFINYWFRHPWECILPLYPGILLAAALAAVPLRDFIAVNALYTVVMILAGFFLSMKNVSGSSDAATLPPKDLRLLWSFLPLLLVLLLVMGLRLELHTALGISLVLLFVFYRSGPKELLRVLKHGFAGEVFVIVFGTMLFKTVMADSGAVAQLSGAFTRQGIPLLPILFSLPFLTGLLTGINLAFIGSTFPLLISMAGGPHLNELTFAFAAGFCGVLLSPVHLCLVLTREYFHADMTGVYRKILPGCAAVMTAALALYFLAPAAF